MKNIARKGLLILAIALFTACVTITPNIGDPFQVGGDILQPETPGSPGFSGTPGSGLDGTWRGNTSGTIITISGDQAVYAQIGNHALIQDAANKGRIVVGGLVFSGINNHSPTIWRAQVRIYNFSSNAPLVNTSVSFGGRVIHMNADGRSFIINNNVNNATIGSATTSSSLVDFVYTRM